MDRNFSDYFPPVLQNIKDFQVISKAVQPELKTIEIHINNILINSFIQDADEYGVKRRESILKITPMPGSKLDERKFNVLAKENARVPFTIRTLKKMLEDLCGEGNVSCERNAFIIQVKVGLESKNNYESVAEMLERVIPMNMIIDLGLKYNRHVDLCNYTYDQLKEYTHYELRNEVIKNE